MDIYIFLTIILGLIFAGFVAWFVYNSFKSNKTISDNSVLKDKADLKLETANTIVVPKKKNVVVITLEESWKFITSIAEEIIAKFNHDDQKMLLQLGKKLAATGMIYNHVIEYGVRYENKQGPSSENTTNTKTNVSKDNNKQVSR
jgi:translation initiation factor 1 (eIF-1/SUI1)